MKVQPGTQHTTLNPRLTEASHAAGEAQERALRESRLLPEAELRAAVEASLRLAPPAEKAPADAAAPAGTFDALQVE